MLYDQLPAAIKNFFNRKSSSNIGGSGKGGPKYGTESLETISTL